MSELPPISREAALRIAMAARILPDTSVGQLLDILTRRIEGELSEESLATITVTDLKTGFGSADGEEDGEDISLGLPAIKEAVRILWGESEAEDLPQAVADAEALPNSIRVAVASNSGELLNGHFGSCLRFLVYELSAEKYQLVDVRSALEADLSDDRNAFRARLINDCQVAYVQSIGGPAAAKVVRAGVYPIKQKDVCEASEVLSRLQGVMENSPPPWLAKILGVAAEDRVRFAKEA
ncbi:MULTISPECIES: dinitrogenase iron-molybdenum cofactor biosynthesis protein [unclassified Oceanobacter]|jgi:nitrogen fixation protein NifX|uniref:dinitrogenase iron-molybdenum cofactor biosynthesis protein n=1 Tax=unclassified Oceanobacter TaxID=2620260 RepID=UPI0026E137E6|nr:MULTISPECIES: dinitrogenase iron-molybdenum cofactor biosynthesis protein [unclassified Oceanobacter]MDO6681717.1 dinitrogenase iron-molybdenum cofactor biosynthesis protein [Oceanobacter sp. 5_MG-2023]MDP2505655.1 dinitrogenase iron-molybdenum cofactor biosynthesis protein [Oceanobacter sp. 3_MG-2023]MDP2608306.1 dinitrogenase iron-molybdenum cofactor biosynthesis protein [Oceanobacter sp. 1_MG-2023]MDP2612191.1 dinitrogenase iron-molybdenum cofactor biosynthesis protein [Oceanobacter sp. 2